MGARSSIEWTDASWTPIRARRQQSASMPANMGWHCEHVSEACKHCYAETINRRLGTGLPFKPGHKAEIEIILDPKLLKQPLAWERPRKIFVCSMTDLFAPFVSDAMISKLFAVMALCPQHVFQVLTKRPERMRAVMPTILSEPLPNVWLGTSIEDQATAELRIPDLLATPARVRFLSCEPLLGPVDLEQHLYPSCIATKDEHDRECGGGLWCDERSIDWVICGGESGPGARPMHPDWARRLRDQCADAGVPFFFKQWGAWVPHTLGQKGRFLIADPLAHGGSEQYMDWPLMQRIGKNAGRLLDGIEHNQFPSL